MIKKREGKIIHFNNGGKTPFIVQTNSWDVFQFNVSYNLLNPLQPCLISLRASICFWGTKCKISREHVAFLHFILWCRAWLWLKLLASTMIDITDIILVLYVLLWRRLSLTSRKLSDCLEILLRFLQLCDRAYASGDRCICLFLLSAVLAPKSWIIFRIFDC